MQGKPKKKLPTAAPRDKTRVDTSGYVSPEDERASARSAAAGLLAGKDSRLTGVPASFGRDEDGVPLDIDSPESREREWYGNSRSPSVRASVAKSKARIANRDEWLQKMFGK